MKNKKNGGAQFWGMIIYDLMGGGNLRGIWTNTHTESNRVLQEMARKKNIQEKDKLEGEYYVSWIEEKGGPVSGILKIDSKITHYRLQWIVSGKVTFHGVGIPLGEKQLAVTYWDGDGITFPSV